MPPRSSHITRPSRTNRAVPRMSRDGRRMQQKNTQRARKMSKFLSEVRV